MTIAYWPVTSMIKWLSRILCRVHDEQLARVPDHGPLIVVANHVNFLEAPIVYTHLLPRPVTGFAKSENWSNPLIRPLANLWGAIPLRRGQADLTAIRSGLAELNAGKILALTPEGTRSGHGRLQRGRPGVALLAIRAGAPVLPIACFGHETFWESLRVLKRTDFYMVVGQSFHVWSGGRRSSRYVRQRIVDEIMYQIAALLPQRNRGVYADLSSATEEYLRFPDGAVSNLSVARD